VRSSQQYNDTVTDLYHSTASHRCARMLSGAIDYTGRGKQSAEKSRVALLVNAILLSYCRLVYGEEPVLSVARTHASCLHERCACRKFLAT
jgi:hypothetical protein